MLPILDLSSALFCLLFLCGHFSPLLFSIIAGISLRVTHKHYWEHSAQQFHPRVTRPPLTTGCALPSGGVPRRRARSPRSSLRTDPGVDGCGSVGARDPHSRTTPSPLSELLLLVSLQENYSNGGVAYWCCHALESRLRPQVMRELWETSVDTTSVPFLSSAPPPGGPHHDQWNML